MSSIMVNDIAEIDIIKGANSFGAAGVNGVIVIYTKTGDSNYKKTPSFHIQSISPLGYQQPIEFYAPKYDTPSRKAASKPDLHTTIHWQPVVQTDDKGNATFQFYTADEPASYTVIIEGLTNEGRIIRKIGKDIFVK